jgi:hypothetical protein
LARVRECMKIKIFVKQKVTEVCSGVFIIILSEVGRSYIHVAVTTCKGFWRY